MGKALALVVTALGSCLLLYWLLAPRFTTPSPASPSSANRPVSTSNQETGSIENRNSKFGNLQSDPIENRKSKIENPSHYPIDPPRSPQQREQDDLETKRGPFYAAMHRNGEALLAAFQPAPEDAATLDLYANRDDNQAVLQLLSLVSRADAYHYGFRHLRFYLPNPPQSVERYRLEAEATPDANGAWQAFQK